MDNLLARLAATRDETLCYFDHSPNDLSLTYGPGKWNIRKILIHLADAEAVLQERIKRVIAEPGQVIWAFDQDRWCEALAYEEYPLALGRGLYAANRQSIMYLAEKYYEHLGEREFVHNQAGKKTLRQEFDKVASHNEGHLAQIRQALSA
jgi:hypothetical protein